MGKNKLMGDKNNEMRGFGESPGGEADFSAPLFTKGAASVEMTIRWFGVSARRMPNGRPTSSF
jgi:hypothetical protein